MRHIYKQKKTRQEYIGDRYGDQYRKYLRRRGRNISKRAAKLIV